MMMQRAGEVSVGRLHAGMRLGALVLLAISVALAAGAAEEELTGSEILSRALDLRKGVNDFSAHFEIQLDIEDMDLPDSNGTVYFKRPDKLKVEPDRGIVILPKDALMPTRISKAIADGADVTLTGKRKTPDGVVYGLKIIPKDDNRGIRLTAWVNGENWTMDKMEVWRDATRAMSITWEHTLVQKRFWLPKSVKCTLAQRAGRVMRGVGRQRMRGTAAISLTDYKVNTGLPDTMFDEPEGA